MLPPGTASLTGPFVRGQNRNAEELVRARSGGGLRREDEELIRSRLGKRTPNALATLDYLSANPLSPRT